MTRICLPLLCFLFFSLSIVHPTFSFNTKRTHAVKIDIEFHAGDALRIVNYYMVYWRQEGRVLKESKQEGQVVL